LTEPDQRDKGPEPAGKWVNAVTKTTVHPDRKPQLEGDLEEGWDAVPEGQLKGLPQKGQGAVPEEARAETPGKIKCPGQI